MEPIPETTQAVEEFGPFAEDDLLARLRGQGDRVRGVVPDCLALSLTSVECGVTFTLVASVLRITDPVPVADGAAPLRVRTPAPSPGQSPAQSPGQGPAEPLDEQCWQLLAQQTAAPWVASSLTLPILSHGSVVASVSLYAGSDRAFDGHHEELATILGAWTPGTVTNADLSFSSRRAAEQAPRDLSDGFRTEVAIGMLATAEELDFELAREQFLEAAQRAGVSQAQLADAVIDLQRLKGGY